MSATPNSDSFITHRELNNEAAIPGGRMPKRRLRPRRRDLAIGVLACLLFGAGALTAAAFIRSPAQQAADAAPPASGPVTAAVEHRVLRSTLTSRGTVGPEQTIHIGGITGRDGAKPVITRLPVNAGDPVTAGGVVAEISGRPVMVLAGAVPAYRDLAPGAQGADVLQLQQALRTVGHPVGKDPAGSYGPGTKAAVAALYTAAGYQPQNTNRDDNAQLLAAQRRLRDARNALATAEHQSPQQPSMNGVDTLRQAVADAAEDLDQLAAHTGAMVPLGEIVFVPALPATVYRVDGSVGAGVTDKPILTLAGGRLVVRAPVTSSDAGFVRAGQTVEVAGEASDKQATGTVATVTTPNITTSSSGNPADSPEGAAADQSGDQHGQGAQLELLIVPDSPLDPVFAGQEVRVTIVAAATAGEVLVVPLAAISVRSDGQSQVQRVGQDGTEDRVQVAAGVSGGGYVEVTPIGTPLNEGDRVVIGR